jgi:hypothetical protein
VRIDARYTPRLSSVAYTSMTDWSPNSALWNVSSILARSASLTRRGLRARCAVQRGGSAQRRQRLRRAHGRPLPIRIRSTVTHNKSTNNGVNPLDYLSDVLLRVQTHPAAEIDDLLPHRWRPRPP